MPAYNEADGIAEFLRELDDCFVSAAIDAAFVVVDDRSTDDTVAVLGKLGRQLRTPLVVVELPVNRGHGPATLAAYRRALEARAAVVIQVDGDGQFDGADVVEVARRTLQAGEVTVGRRVGRSDRWYRAVLTAAVRWYLRAAFGVISPDPNSPLRAYPATTLDTWLAAIPADAVIPNIYLTVLAHRSAKMPMYFPVTHRVRRGVDPEGTTWRGARWAIPTRLIRLVAKATTESIVFRRSVVRDGARL